MARSKQIKPEIDLATKKAKEIAALRDAEVGHIGNLVVGPSKDADGNLVYGTAAVPISNDEV